MNNNFGNCCKDLKDSITAPQKSMFHVMEDNGVLYLAVGYIQAADGRTGWFDQAVIHCPFCGAKLQDKEEIRKKTEEKKS